MTDEDKVRTLFGFGEKRELPSRYWEIGNEEPDKEHEPNYDDEELPFC